MEQTILPKTLCGTLCVPPSKSAAHRAVICAALSGGTSTIQNIAFSDDLTATISAMETFGAHITKSENSVRVCGIKSAPQSELFVDCNESGSTLRFLIPLAWIFGIKVHFSGRGRLLSRPLSAYFDLCNAAGISYELTEDAVSFNGKLSGGHYELPGNVSSQFISGLLFALPLAEKDSRIVLTTKAESVGYIDMTLETLARFGIKIENHNYQSFYIPGGQSYTPCDLMVEGDYSQAAFYLVANALGSHVELLGLNETSAQGDREIISIIKRFGSPLRATQIDASDIPDLVPVLAVLASQAEGTPRIYNAGRLRMKESDRLKTTAALLKSLGAKVLEQEDSLEITGKAHLHGGVVDSFNDHRIAMAAAIAATVAEGMVTVLGSKCVKKSYANFWEDYFSLR